MESYSQSQEADRIKKVYAHRDVSLPPSRYRDWNPAHLLGIQGVERRVLAFLKQAGFTNRLTCDADGRPEALGRLMIRIGDVGCGDGFWLNRWMAWGVPAENLYGIDLRETAVEAANARMPMVQIQLGDATQLPWETGTFDIVVQNLVFTSILDYRIKKAAADEMLRVLAPSGMIVWYDFMFNNPSNPDVRGITKNEIHRLFPDCECRFSRETLAPPLARRLAPISWPLCHVLTSLRFLCTHLVATIKPR